MRNAALILALISSGQLSVRAQDGSTESKSGTIKVGIPVFIIADRMPEFPGGQEKLAKFIRETIKYPEKAMELGIDGKVYLGFRVDKDGTISDPKIEQSIGGGCDEEAIRIVNLMPNWNPGILAGKPVSVRVSIAVNFALR